MRQIFNAIVLATWFKNNLKESLLDKVYANQRKVNGIDLVNPEAKEAVYRNYLQAYKKGVYNFIKEDNDSFSHQIVPRKYFSGGFWAEGTSQAMTSYKKFDDMPARAQNPLLGDRQPARAFVFEMKQPAGVASQAMIASQDAVNRASNLEQLKQIVRDNQGVKTFVVITNIGDEEIVKREVETVKRSIFRADGKVNIVAIGTVGKDKITGEEINRGQFGAILHVQQELKKLGIKNEGVILGALIPGQGTRMSPFTQRHGIKPLISFGLRPDKNSKFLNALEASAYSWNLVAYHLARMGFRGSAWKWGDEPQIPSNMLSALNKDLSDVDAVRFAAPVEVTEDLAKNKEWFLLHADGSINKQLHRRPRSELLQALGLQDVPGVTALAHIGSPAFSNLFIDEAVKIFKDIRPNILIDVDGYLFEALTYSQQEWDAEVATDKLKAEERRAKNKSTKKALWKYW